MHFVLIISSLNSGGAENVISSLANYLVEKHQVTIVTFAATDAKPFYQLNASINLIQLNQTDKRQENFLTRLHNITKRTFSLRKTIKHLNPTAIISFVDLMNITTLISSLGLKIPVLVSERTDPNFHKIPTFYSWLRLKLYPFANKLVVQTSGATKYFPKKINSIIKIIPNPVKTPKLQKVKYSDKITSIVTVGRLGQEKDHKTLIRAFEVLLKHRPYLTLTIYGEGKERSSLEELISSLNLKNNVFLRGVVKNIQEALLSADLFIFPSLYEGFPNALCEAMAMGIPVIASNCSGNVDIIQDGFNGRLFLIGNVKMLTEVTIEILNDSSQCAHLANNAKKVCDDFKPSCIFSMWDQCLEEVSKNYFKENK